MWFWRGTQSAIFYYVACTPCQERSYKKKRKRNADRVQKEREALELKQPGLIQQPLPFQTNKYWAEEISAGPGPPTGWAGHEKPSATRTRSKKTNGTLGKRQSVFADEKTTPASGATGFPSAEAAIAQPEHSTRDTIKESLRAAISPEKWNWIRAERPDEILWGYEPLTKILKGNGREGSTSDVPTKSSTIPGRQRTRTGASKASDASTDYAYMARNPAVNDLHPPIVSSLPRSRDEVAWMLQPPPPAMVMEGKVHPDEAPLPPRPVLPAQTREGFSDKNDRPPKKDRYKGLAYRPPAIIIPHDASMSSLDTGISSRDSSPSPPTTSISRTTSKEAPRTPKGTPSKRHRPPLAPIVSFDDIRTRPVLGAHSHSFNSASSSPYIVKSPSFHDHVSSTDRTAVETNGLHTPPEWDFLLAQMYGSGSDGQVEYEELKPFGYGSSHLGREAGMRASWHGHERRWSEL